MYTIKREIGRLENFSIGLVGDLANGRTVRSLAYLLSMYPDVKMYFVAPEVVRMKEDIKDYLTRQGGCSHYLQNQVHWRTLKVVSSSGVESRGMLQIKLFMP